MNGITEVALTESRSLRASYTDRTDVLDKVKALSLLPDDVHVTTETVASYYEVPAETIKSVVEDNRDELEANGFRSLQGTDLHDFVSPFGGLTNLGLSPKVRRLAVFTRRAVLNVGQLLRDSDIARQVRTHLLDTEAGSRELSKAEWIRQALEIEQERERYAREASQAKQRAAALEPAAEAWQELASADGDFSVRAAAQILSRDPHIATGQRRLFEALRESGWIDKRGEPYQREVDAGRLVRRPKSWDHPHSGEPQLGYQVRVTAKGLAKLRELLGGGAQLDINGGAA